MTNILSTKTLTVILVVVIAALSGVLYNVYPVESTDRPYFWDHIEEELSDSDVTFNHVKLFAYDESETGVNFVYDVDSYEPGDWVGISVSISGYANPKVRENYFTYGVKEELLVFDSYGNIVDELSGTVYDIDNHFEERNKPLVLEYFFIRDEAVEPGEYYIQVVIEDKITEVRYESQEVWFIIE